MLAGPGVAVAATGVAVVAGAPVGVSEVLPPHALITSAPKTGSASPMRRLDARTSLLRLRMVNMRPIPQARHHMVAAERRSWQVPGSLGPSTTQART